MEVSNTFSKCEQSIDGCPHSFSKLSSSILPAYMKQMRWAISDPWPLKIFDTPGIGKRRIMESLGLDEDISGCYVFLAPEPVYVGISRSLIRRVRIHVRGKTHYQATLAYRMTADDEIGSILSRNEKMSQRKFMEKFERNKSRISSWSVAWIEIKNPVELYLFEVYCSMQLKTFKWNTFKTH